MWRYILEAADGVRNDGLTHDSRIIHQSQRGVRIDGVVIKVQGGRNLTLKV